MNLLTIYVAPDGDDSLDGASPEPSGSSGPLATVQAAFSLIQGRKRAGAMPSLTRIVMRGGRYAVTRPVTISPESAAPIRVEPYEDEKPVWSGGERITGWSESLHDGRRVWTVELPEVAAGRRFFRSLYVNDERRNRPRLPKKGLYRMTEVSGMPLPSGWSREGYDRFKLAAGDMRAFANLSDVEAVVPHFWICERSPVAAFDEQSGWIQTALKSRAPLVAAHGSELASCYLDNVMEALTEPGEWYLSRKDGVLTYLPCDGETIENTTVLAPRVLQLLKLVGRPEQGQFVEWITFRDISFRHTDWAWPGDPDVDQDTAWSDPARTLHSNGRGDRASAAQGECDLSGAVFLKGARHCAFEGCTVANVGWYGVDIGDGCQAIALRGCVLNDLGGGGIKINGASYADRLPHLETGRISVTDCRIFRGGRVFPAAIGIHCLHGYANRFAHNEIHDFFYTGISVGWQWNFAPSVCRDNRVEFNHIHHLGGGLLSDMGGVYTLGLQQGGVIRNNLIHHIAAAHYGAWCIYPDEGSSHLLIENNLCHSTNREIFHQHYGRENIVRNNLFAFGDHGLVAYSNFVAPELGFRLVQNILLSRGEPHFVAGYAVTLDMRGHESNFNLVFRTDGKSPVFVKKEGSTEQIPHAISWGDWRNVGHDRQSVFADPLCADAAGLDFTLSSESPAILRLGFDPIRLDRIGPRPRSEWNSYTPPHPRARDE